MTVSPSAPAWSSRLQNPLPTVRSDSQALRGRAYRALAPAAAAELQQQVAMLGDVGPSHEVEVVPADPGTDPRAGLAQPRRPDSQILPPDIAAERRDPLDTELESERSDVHRRSRRTRDQPLQSLLPLGPLDQLGRGDKMLRHQQDRRRMLAVRDHRAAAPGPVRGDRSGASVGQMNCDRIVVAVGATDPAGDHHGLVVQVDVADMAGPRIHPGPGEGLVSDQLGDRLVAQHRAPGRGHAWKTNPGL